MKKQIVLLLTVLSLMSIDISYKLTKIIELLSNQ